MLCLLCLRYVCVAPTQYPCQEIQKDAERRLSHCPDSSPSPSIVGSRDSRGLLPPYARSGSTGSYSLGPAPVWQSIYFCPVRLTLVSVGTRMGGVQAFWFTDTQSHGTKNPQTQSHTNSHRYIRGPPDAKASGGEGHYRTSALPDQCTSEFLRKRRTLKAWRGIPEHGDGHRRGFGRNR